MAQWTVEMSYGMNIGVSVEADTREEAIEKAKQNVENRPSLYADLSGLEFEQVTYAEKDK